MKIAFLDIVGLAYNGDTLSERGLGGSESAVIFMSRELAKLGFDVTVFNKCDSEGIYDGVKYCPLSETMFTEESFDVLVTSRSCLPYVPINFRDAVLSEWSIDIALYQNIVSRSGYKVVWLHDTFCQGDNWLEHITIDGYVDEIFTLSDWHTHYISKAQHQHNTPERRYEVLKRHIFETRNGIHSYFSEVDISKKDKNLFVYNASVSKGMIPLLDACWPRIKEVIPEAKLMIIGGYYRGAGANGPDEQEKLYYKKLEEHDGKNGISFTGVIKQSEIAEILKSASFFLYPGVFPETFGISTLEAINYNVPLIGCRFGALEEIAAEGTSYLIEYAIDYGSLQVDRFVDMTIKAYKDDYLRYQKMNYCNAFKPWIGWDKVALQWKQHFYRKMGLYMPVDETRAARRSVIELAKLFKRRHLNTEDIFDDYSAIEKRRIVVVTPAYNAAPYIQKCIESVAAQNYDNWKMLITDDVSTDDTLDKICKYLDKNPDVAEHVIVYENREKMYAVRNQYLSIQNTCRFGDIVILLDGDDWLVNDPDVFNYINMLYSEGAKMTYGSFHSLADNIDCIAEEYPANVKESGSYRKHLFKWGMPYTHLRTFEYDIWHEAFCDGNAFKLQDENGEWYKAGGDNAVFYNLIETCPYECIKAVQRVLYVYNDLSPLNDYKIHSEEQETTAEAIRNKKREVGEDIIENMRKEIAAGFGVSPELLQSRSYVSPKAIAKFNLEDFKEVEKVKDGIVSEVRAGNPDAIEIYKDIATNRKDVWIDDPDTVNISPRMSWMLGKVRSISKGRRDIKVLDIGSWTGGFANRLFADGYSNITCMDISSEVVKRGSEVFPHLRWIRADVETYPCAEKYDVIMMCEVLEHLVNPKEVIERVIGWLKPGGAIIYTVPSEETVYGQRTNTSASEHISSLSDDWLRSLSGDMERLYVYYNDVRYGIDWYAGSIRKKKRVLIAIPTAKNTESDTFKSIYRQVVPDDVEVHFECFYGYNIAQVRNLIAHYSMQNGFDYVFCVDSDIILPENALDNLLRRQKDIVSGVYIQRKHGEEIPEIYIPGPSGGVVNIPITALRTAGDIIEISGCGFGCVLVSTDAFRSVGYPQFEYHNAIDHRNTVSEDIDFCIKAKQRGIQIYADCGVKCGHIGTEIFGV